MEVDAVLLAVSRLRGELDRLTGELKRQQALAAVSPAAAPVTYAPAGEHWATPAEVMDARRWQKLVELLHAQGWAHVTPQLVAGLVAPVQPAAGATPEGAY